jgi:phosphoribosylformylglycinamidine synthase subunit PurL
VTKSLKHRELGLTDAELDRIEALLGRHPNDLELCIFSLMWSEHCAYKHSRKLLSKLPSESSDLVMGPGENAGAVRIDGGLLAVFKIESHNHPSAVEPFQGAATGVGGILRDIFALGARPVALLNSLRFGELESSRSRYLLERSVAGIGQYGNSVGVATVGGEVVCDRAYEHNCLINVMCLGLASEADLVASAASGVGNLVVLLGASTGRDGIGGASVLASQSLESGSDTKRPSVQIGDPFEEKKLLECTLELAQNGLLKAMQDLGAAGLSSACSEMAAKGAVGIDIDVQTVPLREPDMAPMEIMISESQERMLCIAEQKDLDTLRSICEKWDLEATAIGRVTDTHSLRVFSGPECLCDLPVEVVVDCAPAYDLESEPPARPVYEPPAARLTDPADLTQTLTSLLSSPAIASKRWVYEQYDSLVGSRTVRRAQASPTWAEASILSLKDDGADGGIALTVDGNGKKVAADPYVGTVQAVLEAAFNLGCVGAAPLGVTNCLNFASPEKPEIAWQLERSIEGLADSCQALSVPVVGGNVSLYNEGADGPIYPTPVVGMVGRVPSVDHLPGIGFLQPGHRIALVGAFHPELAASELEKLCGKFSFGLCQPDLNAHLRTLTELRNAIRAGGIASAHDVSDGGVACALAECVIAGGLGARVDLSGLVDRVQKSNPGDAVSACLFGEGPGGVVVSGSEEALTELSGRTGTDEFLWIGEVGGDALELLADSTATLWLSVDKAQQAHEGGVSSYFL